MKEYFIKYQKSPSHPRYTADVFTTIILGDTASQAWERFLKASDCERYILLDIHAI